MEFTFLGMASAKKCLSSLVELNLSGNNFVDISQASLNMLPQLRILELVSCERFERLPELPTTIEEVFADNCTSLMTDNVGILMLQQISFTICVGLLENQQMHDMATSLWLYLFKVSLRLHLCLLLSSYPLLSYIRDQTVDQPWSLN